MIVIIFSMFLFSQWLILRNITIQELYFKYIFEYEQVFGSTYFLQIIDSPPPQEVHTCFINSIYSTKQFVSTQCWLHLRRNSVPESFIERNLSSTDCWLLGLPIWWSPSPIYQILLRFTRLCAFHFGW